MKQGARTSAAIEILGDVSARNRPASDALRDWGRSNRFAGSSDRAAIGNLVYAALRRKASLAAAMGDDTPRSLILGALRWVWGIDADAIAAQCDGERHSAEPLSVEEVSAIAGDGLAAGAPEWVQADVPEWIWPEFVAAFGDKAVAEGAALATRPPVDIRVNSLKSSREKVLKALDRHDPVSSPLSPVGVRFPTPEGPRRHPNVEAEAAHGRGHFEVQDEGSQLAATLTGARPGMQVVDYCAGAGGKTLAMAAQMAGKGQIHAFDADRRRLRPLIDRMRRAGAHNIQVRDGGSPNDDGLSDLEGRADLVLIDAPCTGAGTWRRRPEAKWRLKPAAVEDRQAEQSAILAAASRLVRPGGRLAYVTCSVLPSENGRQISEFLEKNQSFRLVPYGDAWDATIGSDAPASADGATETLLLTPASHGTDGFFIALLERRDS